MKRHIAIFIIFSFASTYIFCQNLQTTIKIQAMDMSRALINNDFATFSTYMYPKIVSFAGGKDKMKSDMDSASSAMKQFGVAFKRILIGNPGAIIHFHDQLQCVVPQTTTMQTLMGDLEAETSLIAISTDNGKKWFFIDTNVYRVDKIKNALPELSPDLVIPPQKSPKLINNQ
ncbi:MAG TPA: hypothetical protein VFV08_09830 [Puia sp.]|nr:hypothetical protein [Puia sp.]